VSSSAARTHAGGRIGEGSGPAQAAARRLHHHEHDAGDDEEQRHSAQTVRQAALNDRPHAAAAGSRAAGGARAGALLEAGQLRCAADTTSRAVPCWAYCTQRAGVSPGAHSSGCPSPSLSCSNRPMAQMLMICRRGRGQCGRQQAAFPVRQRSMLTAGCRHHHYQQQTRVPLFCTPDHAPRSHA